MAILTKYMVMYPISDDNTLMINTLTSAQDIIDNTTKHKIENMKNGIQDIIRKDAEELYDQLMSRGYLFENENAEKELIDRLRLANLEFKKHQSKMMFTICPTMGCNLRCTYCFESEEQHLNFDLMSDEQLDGIFRYINETVNSTQEKEEDCTSEKSPTIMIFGGEPLLNRNYPIVKRIIEFADLSNMKVSIISNGTYIERYKDLLSKYSKRITIQITIDGDQKIHDARRIRADGSGTFNQIRKNVNELLNIGIPVSMRINVDRINIKSLNELEAVIGEEGWGNNPLFMPYASPVQEYCGMGPDTLTEHELLDGLVKNHHYGNEKAFIKKIISPSIGYASTFFDPEVQIKPWKIGYCEATAGNNLCFTPDGKISTCLSYLGNGKYTIGTFDKNGVVLNMDDYKLWTERDVFRIEKCHDCKYAFICGGGCAVAAIETNQNIDDRVCGDVEKTMESYVSFIKDALLNELVMR
jgi:radical SAM additional 4Fe4S-binding domain